MSSFGGDPGWGGNAAARLVVISCADEATFHGLIVEEVVAWRQDLADGAEDRNGAGSDVSHRPDVRQTPGPGRCMRQTGSRRVMPGRTGGNARSAVCLATDIRLPAATSAVTASLTASLGSASAGSARLRTGCGFSAIAPAPERPAQRALRHVPAVPGDLRAQRRAPAPGFGSAGHSPSRGGRSRA